MEYRLVYMPCILEMHLGIVGKKLGDQIQGIYDNKSADYVAQLRSKI